MALYRRYRPQTFQDVIGQDHVTRPIMAALRADRTAHAYLFSGPRGCGKTTSARILARCLNCAQGPTDTPCGECDSCRELSLHGGGSLDVIEMDAASHGRVDDARGLIERAAFAPARDRYKIFIIDEAHMVSKEGFNALLKLVEEPPPHIKFIFATTEPDKVIGTIRSRTHHYPFRLVPPSLLESYLSGICAEEGIHVGGGVLSLVVRAGGGSVRDSLSVLDQLIGGSEDGTLTYDQAISLLGYTDGSLLDDAVEAVAASDGATLFSVVDRVIQSGHDPRRFVEDLLQRLRDVIVITLAGDQAGDVLSSVPLDQLERMRAQAEHLGARAASRAADLTNEALSGMVGATSPRLQLELLCARLLVPDTQPSSDTPPEPVRAAAPVVRPASAQRPPTVQRAQQGSPAVPGRKISPAWAAAQNAPAVHMDTMPSQQHMESVQQSPAQSQPVPLPAQQTPAPQAEAVRVQNNQDPAQQSGWTPQNDGVQPVSRQQNVPQSRMAVGEPVNHGERRAAEESRVPQASLASQHVPHRKSSDAGKDVSIIRERWSEIVAAAGSRSTAALVNSDAVTILGIRDGVLGIGFKTAGLATTFNEKGEHSYLITKALHDVLGVDLHVRGLIGGSTDPKAEAARDVAATSNAAVAPQASVQAHRDPQQVPPVAAVVSPTPVPSGVCAPPGTSPIPKTSAVSALPNPVPSVAATVPAAAAVPDMAAVPERSAPPVVVPQVPSVQQSAPQLSPEVMDSSDLEARGLVLATDSVDIPAGPPPSRDQLAAALKALEAEQAAREDSMLKQSSAQSGPDTERRVADHASALAPAVPTSSEDPAGVLAALADGSAVILHAKHPRSADTQSTNLAVQQRLPGRSVEAVNTQNEPAHPSPGEFFPPLPDEPPAFDEYAPEGSDPYRDGGFSRDVQQPVAPLEPAVKNDEPFYAQRMPMPPKPENIARPALQINPLTPRSAASLPPASTQLSAPAVAPAAHAPTSGFSVPQFGAAGYRTQTSPTGSLAERILAEHGEGAPRRKAVSEEQLAKLKEEEEEVSLNDPTISQSRLVGIDVVLETFKGAIIEEIPRNNGGN